MQKMQSFYMYIIIQYSMVMYMKLGLQWYMSLCRPAHKHGRKGRIYREDPYVFLTEESHGQSVWELIK